MLGERLIFQVDDAIDLKMRVDGPTLPDDCIPFITMKNTTIQLSKRQSTIHHFRPSPSSIDGAASKVVLYQKYAVSELFTHSSMGLPSSSGHVAHGSDCYIASEYMTISNRYFNEQFCDALAKAAF